MKFLSEKECEAWCAEHHFPPALSGEEFHWVDIPFPKDSGKKVVLARVLHKTLQPTAEILLWLDDWAVWPSCQHMPLFTRFRESLGEKRPLIETPRHLLTGDEVEDAISIIAVSLLFCWDCNAYASTGRDAFKISHDELSWFVSRDSETAKRIQEKVYKSFPRDEK